LLLSEAQAATKRMRALRRSSQNFELTSRSMPDERRQI
jgi:hypothetical protein